MNTIIKHIDYDCNGLEAVFKSLVQEFPFLKLSSIGKTVGGRDIRMLRLGKSNDYILYTAAIHGSERITATVLLRFIADLCDALKNGKSIVLYASFLFYRPLSYRLVTNFLTIILYFAKSSKNYYPE